METILTKEFTISYYNLQLEYGGFYLSASISKRESKWDTEIEIDQVLDMGGDETEISNGERSFIIAEFKRLEQENEN